MYRFALIILLASSVFAQNDPTTRAWNQPVEPFRIIGNIYYVGAAEVTSFLITSPRGHILLDGGLPETAAMIVRNIETLGFKSGDVRFLLNSHAHFDHAGGLAELKRLTGARLRATAGDIPLLARGGKDDPQFGDKFPYEPVFADAIVADGDVVRVGAVSMQAHITPGHTRGCTTWTTRVEGRNVSFLCSPTIPSQYRIVGNPRYPDAVADYRRHFDVLKSIPCEVFLAAHASFFGLDAKRKRQIAGDESAFVDPVGCRVFIQRAEQRFTTLAATQGD